MKYVAEKLRNAVRALAASDASLEQRLGYAAVAVVTLDEDSFGDAESKAAFKELRRRLTAKGSYLASIADMNAHGRRETAELFVSLNDQAAAADALATA